ncbi:MAG: hypothetical protein ACE5EX_09395, partial [Phycisphaerae bacterium]
MMQTLTRITLGKDGRKGALGVTAVLLMGLFLPGRPVLGQADAPAPDKPQEKAAAAPQEAPRDPNAEPDIDPAEDDQSVAGAPSDSLDELLRSLESNPLNLSGAELDMEVIGDQLILRGNQNDLDIVELLVRMLESTGEKKVLRVVTVTEKDAKEIASTIEAPLQAVFFEPNRRPELELSITALSSNIVLVSALPDQLDFIVG